MTPEWMRAFSTVSLQRALQVRATAHNHPMPVKNSVTLFSGGERLRINAWESATVYRRKKKVGEQEWSAMYWMVTYSASQEFEIHFNSLHPCRRAFASGLQKKGRSRISSNGFTKLISTGPKRIMSLVPTAHFPAARIHWQTQSRALDHLARDSSREAIAIFYTPCLKSVKK